MLSESIAAKPRRQFKTAFGSQQTQRIGLRRSLTNTEDK